MLGGLAGGRVGSGCGRGGPTGEFWRIARRRLFLAFSLSGCRAHGPNGRDSTPQVAGGLDALSATSAISM